MASLRFFITIAALGALATACGQKPQPESAPPPSAPEPAPTGVASPPSEPAGETEPAPAASAAPEAAAPPAGPPVGELCETMCDAQRSKCNPEQLKLCKHNYCSRYAGAPDVCEPAARAALECARSQPDFLLCSNVVPETCAKRFFAVEKCLTTGEAPPPEAEGPKTPEGWARFTDKSARFSLLMPKGVEKKSEGDTQVWSSSLAEVSYSVSLGPPPKEKKFDGKAFLRIATKLLGRCAPKMKLYAIVEKPESTTIQYSTVCPDKSQERGVLAVYGPDYFVLRARWGDTPNPHADTFAYSFERK